MFFLAEHGANVVVRRQTFSCSLSSVFALATTQELPSHKLGFLMPENVRNLKTEKLNSFNLKMSETHGTLVDTWSWSFSVVHIGTFQW